MTQRPLPPAGDPGDTVVGVPAPPREALRTAAADSPTQVPAAAPPVAHEVTVAEHHRFAQALCSCGWQGAARRARGTARTEARDHALLYAGAGPLIPEQA